MILLRRLVFLFQKDLLDYVRIERNVPAVEATSNTFLDPLTTGALWLGIGALVVAAIAALTGPYGWAVRLRTGTVRLARSVGSAVSGKAEDPATAAWIAANLDKLRIAGAVVGVLLIWWIDVSWLGFFLLAALVGAYELAAGPVGRAGDPGRARAGRRHPLNRAVSTTRHAVEGYVPGLRRSAPTSERWLRADLVAGLVLAAILVPQGMAYAELAGLPPVTGLYTTIACLVGYALFGPSRVLVLGPDSSVSPLIFAAITPARRGRRRPGHRHRAGRDAGDARRRSSRSGSGSASSASSPTCSRARSRSAT